MAYWPDTGTGVDVEPARKPVQSALRKYFTEGAPGVPPTVPGGDWFNQMTNEVLNVLEAAGIEPSKTEDDQLLKAIRFLLNGNAVTSTTISSGSYSVGEIVTITDRGGAVAIISSGVTPDGETRIDASNGLCAVIFDSYRNKMDTYSSVVAAFASAKAQGIKCLYVEGQVSAGSIPAAPGSVSLLGNGSINGVPRKRVAKLSDPSSATFNDINPQVHLRRFLGKKSPVVVVVGDSIATESGANVPKIDALYHRLCAKFESAFPDKTITFYNRAIGGETYFSAVGLPVSFPVWYTDHTRGWVRYVGDLQPDLIVFNFGMNDGSNLHTNKMMEYQGYLDNSAIFPAGRPDVIYCTNLTPALDTTFAGLGTSAAQSARDHVSGFTRTFAKSIGAGLLDFHRQCCIVKDGFDPTDTTLVRVGEILTSNGAAVASDYPCSDFKWELSLSLPIGANFAVRLGSPADAVIDPAGRGSYVVIYNDGGNLKADFFTADIVYDAVIYASFTTSVAIPSGSFVLTVEKRQSECVISVDSLTALVFGKLRVGGADVPPKAGDANYTSGPITNAVLWVGRYKTYKQSMVNDDLWGTSDNTAVQRQPYGGNGANHPSSLGNAAIFQPVIDHAHISGDGYSYGNLTLLNGWRAVPGKMPSRASRVGNQITINFSVQVPTTGTPANGVVANVPAGFRPPAGASAYGIIQSANSSGSIVQCDLSSNGDIRIYQNIDTFAWGIITFVLSS